MYEGLDHTRWGGERRDEEEACIYRMEDRYSSRLRATVFCTDNHPTVKKVSDGPR